MAAWFNNLVGSNNTNDQHQHQHHQYQTQQQKYMQKKSQISVTAQTQRVKEQIDDTFEMIVLVAEMSMDQNITEKTINRATDGVILQLNCLAGTCAEIYKQSNQNAIDIAKKQVIDKWAVLKSQNEKLYNSTIPHLNFVIQALDGVPNLKYNAARVNSTGKQKKLFEHNPKTLNGAFSQIIKCNQEFDERQESFLDPNVNKQLGAQHNEDLKQFHTNSRYQQEQSKQKYKRPKQSDLYFTQSGKNAKFVHKNHESDEQSMEDELLGVNESDDVYNKLPKSMYGNAALKFSNRRKWNGINKLFPCKIIFPDRKHDGNKIYEKVIVRPAYPYNDADFNVKLELIETNNKKIKKCEQKHLKEHGELGWESIEQREQREQMEKNTMDIEFDE